MAAGDASIRAYKAMPGAASRTMAPQGGLNAPNFGQFSPLAMQLANEGGYARTYGGFLPRRPRTFTEGAFGPFSPILPVAVDQPAPGAELPDARLYQYMVGWNLPVGTPGTEGIKLADFGTLKTLADLYSVARACIELRKNQICSAPWDIVPTRDAAKAYHGSNRQWRDFGERRGQVLKFMSRPDPDYFSFRNFLSAMLEEILVFDALSVLLRPKRLRGQHRGILGTDLDCIELINGPTMRPLIGMHGETPRPPNPAYQQYLYGVPRSDYMTMVTERDIDEGGLSGAEVNSWTTDQLLYLPMVPRRWTPYGFPPIERALIPVMSGLQKQAFQLDYFKEGTVPAVYVSPGDVNMTPNQIRELQDALNAFAGDPAWHHKVIVLPPGSKVDPQKPVDVADEFDTIVMNQVCMAFNINPMELGIIPKVATVPSTMAVQQMAEAGGQTKEQVAVKPLLRWLADVFDTIIQGSLGQKDMRFTFQGMGEGAEQGELTGLLVQQIQSGLRSVDEAREELELQPWGLPMTTGPVIFTAAGPIPFDAPVLPATPGQAQGGQQKPAQQAQGARDSVRRAPTAGPAPLQQAGRQGGVAAPTPGHAAATAANPMSRTTPSQPSGRPRSVAVSAAKTVIPAALKAELEALARHLGKGRQITTWDARYIPGHAMASISEDLAKGLSPQQCTDIARTMLLGREDYEWLPKAESPWPALEARYRPLIADAFSRAADEAAGLIRDWWSGLLAVPRQELVSRIQEAVSAELGPVLAMLWADAWRSADETAGGYFEAWLASEGRNVLEMIARARRKELTRAVRDAVAAGAGPGQLTASLPVLLDAVNRTPVIAATEVARAAAAASVTRFRAELVTYKQWVTMRDGRVCPACLKAQAEGPVPVESLFSNGLSAPPGHPNCLPGDSLVAALGVTSATSRVYDGELVRIRTVSGKFLRVTPNHPVLTDAGWVAAGLLQEGDNVVCALGDEWESRGDYHHDDMPASIQEIAETFLSSPGVVTAEMPVAAEDFHGDGTGSDVCVVGSGCCLNFHGDPAFAQPAGEQYLQRRADIAQALTGLRDGSPVRGDLPPAPHSVVGGSGSPAAVSGSGAGSVGAGLLTRSAQLDALLHQESGDRRAADILACSEGFDALAGEVTLDKVISVGRQPFSGHVYNLETADGWYIGNGIIVHNCRCHLEAVAGKAAVITKDQSRQLHGEEKDVTCSRGCPDPHHGEYGAAGLLIRHRGPDGKWRYLLQQRSADEDEPNSWGIPGGAVVAADRNVIDGAFREAEEEMGPVPPGVTIHHHVTDDHGPSFYDDGTPTGRNWAFTTLVCDSPEIFLPDTARAATPDESSGFAWHTKEEIRGLTLHAGFDRAWEAVLATRQNATVGKCAVRRVNLDGQVTWEHPDPCRCGDVAAGGGGPQFMPHDAQGIQHGRASGSRGGGTAGHYDDGSLGSPVERGHQEGDDGLLTGGYERGRGLPNSQLLPGYQAGYWPRREPGQQDEQPGAQAPGRVQPRSDGSGRRDKGETALTAGGGAGGEVLRQMRENFPDAVLGWMTRSHWTGPHVIPLDQIDYSDRKEWSAWREKDRVRHFEKVIREGGDFNPVVLIRVPGKSRLRIVDGHHRGLAFLNLGEPVRGWIGDIPAELQEPAEETHSSQLHSGSSKENK